MWYYNTRLEVDLKSSKKTGLAKATKKKDLALTDDEQAMAERHLKVHKRPKARIIIEDKNVIGFDHEEQAIGQLALMEALGTSDTDFFNPFLSQLANAASVGSEPQERPINFMISVIKGIEPRDQLEAMLGAQMAAVHMATMNFARRLNHVDNIPQQDAAEKAFNKLTRTFTSQMEALRKYRTGGEQKVTVKHVTVNEGGQAVVGNVTDNSGGTVGANSEK